MADVRDGLGSIHFVEKKLSAVVLLSCFETDILLTIYLFIIYLQLW